MENYLKEHHDEDVTNLLNNSDDILHVSININLSQLQRTNPELFSALLQNTHAECLKWNNTLLEVQKSLIEGNMFLEPGFQIKENCHARFVHMPLLDPRLKIMFPNNDNVGQFLQIKGNVVRITQARLLEYKREYYCSRCKQTFTIEAEYVRSFVFEPLKNCPNQSNGNCRGIPHQKSAQPHPGYCMDFQEIRIQEMISDRNVPSSLIVTLDNDLVDTCQPGDCVTICGTIERRWKPLCLGKRSEVIISMRAISVYKDENKATLGKDLPEQLLFVRAEWQNMIKHNGELAARDMILRSICPEVHGMYLVKLAVALALSSCSERNHSNGTAVRGHSHLLLVGDPGLAKSRLLKYASEISVRSVHTTGMGCSAAGLTAAAIKEEGEWQLEAGALVLADGGICCIDEFNLMRESDKASIHEAMEQQTISMAKAGLVCKLSTRCVVLAATNPKNLYSMMESEGTSSVNIGIGSPLLSRFDIVLILRDERDVVWDTRVADHILNVAQDDGDDEDDYWELEKLQSHFLAIKDVHPVLSAEANAILGAYYKACRADPMRDPSRTSVRLLDSLVRLSQAHARLLFRTEVTPLDAITVIRLIESSWGFGRVLAACDLIREKPPLGPNQAQADELITLLHLNQIVRDFRIESVAIHKSPRRKSETAASKSKWDNIKVVRPALHLEDLHSKFSFTCNTRKTTKKLKKSTSPEVDENFNDDQIESILGSLKSSFDIANADTVLNTPYSIAKDSSFNSVLDLDNIFEETDKSDSQVELPTFSQCSPSAKRKHDVVLEEDDSLGLDLEDNIFNRIESARKSPQKLSSQTLAKLNAFHYEAPNDDSAFASMPPPAKTISKGFFFSKSNAEDEDLDFLDEDF